MKTQIHHLAHNNAKYFSKKAIILMLLLLATFKGVYGQVTQDRTITVYGSVPKNSSDVTYKTDITLTLDNSYYSDNPCKTIDELKAKYFEELKKLKISSNRFVVDDLAHAATGYRTDGTVLHFETKNKDEILKVTSIRMAQVMPSYVQAKYNIDETEIAKLTTEALKDARKNADIVAKAAGEEIEKLHAVSSYDYGSGSYWTTLNADQGSFRLTVVYKLKD